MTPLSFALSISKFNPPFPHVNPNMLRLIISLSRFQKVLPKVCKEICILMENKQLRGQVVVVLFKTHPQFVINHSLNMGMML